MSAASPTLPASPVTSPGYPLLTVGSIGNIALIADPAVGGGIGNFTGTVNSAGSIGNVTVAGNVAGMLNATHSIGDILVHGTAAQNLTLNSGVAAGDKIGNVAFDTLANGNTATVTIMAGTTIGNISVDAPAAGETANLYLAANAGVTTLGNITVDGQFGTNSLASASTIGAFSADRCKPELPPKSATVWPAARSPR